MVGASAISRGLFETEVASAINQFIIQIPARFQWLFRRLTEMFHGNLLPTAFNTDWSLKYGNESNDYLLRSVPRAFINSTCTCAVSDKCQQFLRIGPPDLILPGLVIGCYPIDGLGMSTLECFFSSECIATIISFLEYYTQLDGSPPVNFTPPIAQPSVLPPMDRSTPSRFPLTTPIGTTIDELFIEQWNNTSSYEKYLAACASTECRYEYVRRNSLLYVVTSLLGLYGGLTVGLRLIS